MFFSLVSSAQIELTGTPYHNKKSQSKLQERFTSYSLYQIDINNIRSDYKNQDNLVVDLSLGKSIRAEVVLFKNDLLASTYSTITDGGKQLDIDRSQLASHFEGYILDDPTSEVRLSFADNYIYGYIQQGKVRKYIEPATTFDHRIAKNAFVVYSPSEVKTSAESFCAATHVNKKLKETQRSLKMAVDCAVLDIAVALDNSYVQAYNNNTGAINQSVSILNMVEPNYNSGAFTSNFKFSIVQHFIPTGADPWSTSSDAGVLLSSFTSWAPSGFSATHDIGQFWTNKDIFFGTNSSVAGLAWVGTVCGNAGYHILEDFTTSAWQLRVLTSHEMGHNFGAGHDPVSGNIMWGSVNANTNSWSSFSQDSINLELSGFNCFDECFEGNCSTITSVVTSNCSVGLPSTYTLSIDITHGGGDVGSTGFNVNVDGGSYFQSWETSPQTVIIDGLTSNGTVNHPITITTDQESEAGCNASATFDEPTADCSLNVVEDFNNCQKPQGWTTATTLDLSINNGDPFVQYQWKFLGTSRTFGNYASFSNSSTTKTLDGTCMAIMDDDLFSISWYTGTVTMTTTNYDAADYESLILEFDYLFHPFEDGGKGANNSYFRVEVWDGFKYVSILNDGDSECPWSDVWDSSCIDHPVIDVTEYKNADFNVKFTYSDGNSWAGMAALDNFKLTGIPQAPPLELAGECDGVVIVSGENVSGEFGPNQMITTNGEVGVNGNTLFIAEVVELTAGFEVSANTEFTVQKDACSTF